MQTEAQCQLIREFMVAVAPPVTAYSLETGADMIENAALILTCSMQLAARYNELYETLTAAPQNSIEVLQPKAGTPAPGIRSPQARIPLDPYDVPDLPGSHGA